MHSRSAGNPADHHHLMTTTKQLKRKFRQLKRGASPIPIGPEFRRRVRILAEIRRREAHAKRRRWRRVLGRPAVRAVQRTQRENTKRQVDQLRDWMEAKAHGPRMIFEAPAATIKSPSLPNWQKWRGLYRGVTEPKPAHNQ